MKQTLTRPRQPVFLPSPAEPAPLAVTGKTRSSRSALPMHSFARLRMTATEPLQRCACEDETRRTELQRTEASEDLGGQDAGGDDLATADVSGIVSHGLASGGQPLDPDTRAFMEPRFGHDFSQVRIHDNAQASASTHSVAARAYTVGSDIAFRAGEFLPGSGDGRRLLAHELTHVVQQGAAAPLAPGVQRSLWVSQMTGLGVQRDDDDTQDGGISSIDPNAPNMSVDPNATSSTDQSSPSVYGPPDPNQSVDPNAPDPNAPNMSVDPNAANQSPLAPSTNQQQDSDAPQAGVLGANTHMPGGPYHPPDGISTKCTPDDDCSSLSLKINYLKHTIQSHQQWDGSNPMPDYPDGRHTMEIADLQNALNNCINLTNKCKNQPRWVPVPEEKTAPETAPAKNAEPQQSTASHISWDKVVDVLAILGLSAALAVGIIAALADPEPATKLGAMGLDAAMAAKLMQMLGMAS